MPIRAAAAPVATVTISAPVASTAPSAVVRERLDDPAVAAALVTLLDNAELLSTLVLGVSEFAARGETIMDTVAEAVGEFKASNPDGLGAGLPSLSDVRELATTLNDSLPTIRTLLSSKIVAPETVALLTTVTEAAAEGMAEARSKETKITGALGAVRALKDPDVARGVGVFIEIAKSLGRRVGTADPSTR